MTSPIPVRRKPGLAATVMQKPALGPEAALADFGDGTSAQPSSAGIARRAMNKPVNPKANTGTQPTTPPRGYLPPPPPPPKVPSTPEEVEAEARKQWELQMAGDRAKQEGITRATNERAVAGMTGVQDEGMAALEQSVKASQTPTPPPAPTDGTQVIDEPPGDWGGTDQTGSPDGSSPNGDGVPTSSVPEYQADAITREVGQQETVQGQIQSLIQAGNPILEAAKERAKLYASGRGLANSVMAAQAGEEALLNAAVPIASADAGTHSRQAIVNQDAQNQFRSTGNQHRAQAEAASAEREWQGGENERQRFANAELTQAELDARERMNRDQLGVQQQIATTDAVGRAATANAEREARLRLGEMDIASRERLTQGEWQNRLQVAGLDADTRTRLAQMGIDADNQRNLASLNQNTLTNYGNQVTQIMSNPDLSTEDKQTAIRNLTAIYSGSPYLPVSINWNTPGNGTTSTGNPLGRNRSNPPPPPPPPGDG